MERIFFGKTNDNRETYLYTLENDFCKITATDYGATLVSLIIKDRNIDVVQGFDSVYGYENEVEYMGQSIGRVCNRIGKGQFILNGHQYNSSINNNGNSLHGGKEGFNRKLWKCESEDNKLVFTYFSKDGEEGYPGNLEVIVTYELLCDGVGYSYEGISDQDTLFSMTNHSFFNLDGLDSDTILNHELKINASSFAGVDENGCTFDDVYEVKGTAFDFREFKKIGKDIGSDEIQLKNGTGYDHHFLVEGQGFRHFLTCKGKSIEMNVYSDLPGFHMYTANFLDNTCHGKLQKSFPQRSSVCFETQFYPNAIQSEKQIKPILKKGVLVKYHTEFKFK